MKRIGLICILVMALCASASFAGVRRFTFLYEANVSAPGSFEFENWITWKTGSDFDRIQFRHEVEYGVSDKFQASIYFADWSYESDKQRSETRYSNAALELIYNLTNPVVDPVGLSLYGEFKGGDEVIELESKLIAQKNFGPLILAYNATLEATWEGPDLADREGELSQALGASYEMSPRFSCGIELLHEFVFPEWRGADHASNFFVGPNISYRRSSWFVTVTALAQATDTEGEPDLQLRTIFGIGL